MDSNYRVFLVDAVKIKFQLASFAYLDTRKKEFHVLTNYYRISILIFGLSFLKNWEIGDILK